MPENNSSSSFSSRRRFCLTSGSLAITSTLSKNRSTAGRNVEISSKARRYLPARNHLCNLTHHSPVSGAEIFLLSLGQKLRRNSSPACQSAAVADFVRMLRIRLAAVPKALQNPRLPAALAGARLRRALGRRPALPPPPPPPRALYRSESRAPTHIFPGQRGHVFAREPVEHHREPARDDARLVPGDRGGADPHRIVNRAGRGGRRNRRHLIGHAEPVERHKTSLPGIGFGQRRPARRAGCQDRGEKNERALHDAPRNHARAPCAIEIP